MHFEAAAIRLADLPPRTVIPTYIRTKSLRLFNVHVMIAKLLAV